MEASSSTREGSVPILTSKNWVEWKAALEGELLARDLWRFVTNVVLKTGVDVPEQPTRPDGYPEGLVDQGFFVKSSLSTEKIASAMSKAAGVILRSLGSESRGAIPEALRVPFLMFRALEARFGTLSNTQWALYLTELISVKLVDHPNIYAYLDRVSFLCNKVRKPNFEVDGIAMRTFILQGLTADFQHVSGSILANDLSGVEKIQAMIIDWDKQRGITLGGGAADDKPVSGAASSKRSKRFERKPRNDRKGSQRDEPGEKEKAPLFVCPICKKRGRHTIDDCWELERLTKAKKSLEELMKSGVVPRSGAVTHEDENNKDVDIYVDSGCNYPMTYKEAVVSGKRLFSVGVKLADNSSVPAASVGTWRVSTSPSTVLEVPQALVVPKLGKNLLSLNRLCQRGTHVGVQDSCGFHLIEKGSGRVVLDSGYHKGLLKVRSDVGLPSLGACLSELPAQVLDSPPTASPAMARDVDADVLHRRLIHCNADDISVCLKRTGLAVGMARSDVCLCPSCVMSKATRKSIEAGVGRVGEVCMLIDSDLSGKMPTRSRGGHYYWALFIDNHSRFVRIYFLRRKSDAFQAFHMFKAWIEKRTGRKIKRFRPDRGGEYVGKEFRLFLDMEGIEFTPASSNTPEQNPVSERFNRTLKEGVRTLLSASNMPESFWVDAARFFVYVHNRMPRARLGKVAPIELLEGRELSILDLKYVRTFGARGYIVVPKSNRASTLKPKGEAMVYLGVADNGVSHRMWNPRTKREIESREVVFDELILGLPGREILYGEAREYHDVEEKVEMMKGIPVEKEEPDTARPYVSSSPAKQTLSDMPPPVTDPLRPEVAEVVERPKRVAVRKKQRPQAAKIEDCRTGDPVDGKCEVPVKKQVAEPVRRSSRGRIAAQRLEYGSLGSNKWVEVALPPPKAGREDLTSPTAQEEPTIVEEEPDSAVDNGSVELESHIDAVMKWWEATPEEWVPRVRDPIELGREYSVYQDVDDAIFSGAAGVGGATFDIEEPLTYKQAVTGRSKDEWIEAMAREWGSLVENKTFELCMLPEGRHAIGAKWVYKVKRLADGNIDRLKARLVAIGTSQREGVDYFATFAPVVRQENLRAVLALGALRDMEIHQMDVDSAFLNGILEEEIYMRQPMGFVDEAYPQMVLRLLKSLYGLKQAPRVWNLVLSRYLLKRGFVQSKADPCIFIHQSDEGLVIVAIYVDDCCIVADAKRLGWAKQMLRGGFQMKDLGEAKSLLGMQVIRNRETRELRLVQGGLTQEIIRETKMDGCNPCRTPMEAGLSLMPSAKAVVKGYAYRSLIGKLLYLSVCTRPDIAFAVNYLSRFVTCYGEEHWEALKRVVRYLKGTALQGVVFRPSDDRAMGLIGYGDADWGSDRVDRRSTSGYVFFFAGGPISWKVRKQTIVALSSVEAEYLSATEATKQALHHRTLLRELGMAQAGPTVIKADNQGCIALTENPVHHDRTKHFDIRHHFVREKVQEGSVVLDYLPTGEMIADIMTKALPMPAFVKLKGAIMG